MAGSSNMLEGLDLTKVNHLLDGGDHYQYDHVENGQGKIQKKGLPPEVQSVLDSIALGHKAAADAIKAQAGSANGVGHAASGGIVSPVLDPSGLGEGPSGFQISQPPAPPTAPDMGQSNLGPSTPIRSQGPAPVPPGPVGPPAPPGTISNGPAGAPAAVPAGATVVDIASVKQPPITDPFTPMGKPKQTPYNHSELDKAIKDHMAGIEATATAQKGLADQSAAIETDQVNLAKHISDERQRIAQDTEREAKGVSDWLADPANKVDPRRLYHSMDTGQRVGAAISMFLGTLSEGFSRTPSHTLQMMHNALVNDVEAQIRERGDKQTQLQAILDKGIRLDNAKKILLGDSETIAAGQLRAAANRWGGPAALAAAQAAAGQLEQDAVKLKTEGLHAHLDEQALPIKQEMDRRKANLDNEGQFLQNKIARQGYEAQRAMISHGADPFLATHPKEAYEAAQKQKESDEKQTINIPVYDGKTGEFQGMKSQKIVGSRDVAQKAYTGLQEQSDKLQAIQDFIKQKNIGGTGTNIFDAEDKQQLRALLNDFTLSFPKNSEGLGRFSDTEKELIDEMRGGDKFFAVNALINSIPVLRHGFQRQFKNLDRTYIPAEGAK